MKFSAVFPGIQYSDAVIQYYFRNLEKLFFLTFSIRPVLDVYRATVTIFPSKTL